MAGFFLANTVGAQSFLDNTQLRFFTDAGFIASRDSTNKLMPGFQFGGIEILLTSQITDKISLLAEPVLRPDGTVSMERVMLKYSFSHYFNFSAGRLYTPIGLWNTTFFRYAKALTPTIDAPQIIANFEEGGTAINKDNGIQISGDDISTLRFGYRLMIGNGYNRYTSRNKIIFGNAFIEPIDNLKFSLFVTHQKVNAAILPIPDGSLKAIGVSIMHIGDKNIEFATEFHRAYFKIPAMPTTAENIYYAYAGYKFKNLTPYVQYYNGILNFSTDYDHATLGVRHNFSALSLLKLEAQFLESDDFTKVNQVKLLWAVGF